MKLLFLTSRLPWPPDRGDRLRTYHLLRTFSQEHEIVLLSFIANEKEANQLDKIKDFCQEIHLVHLPQWRSTLAAAFNAWRGTPLQLEFYRSRKMQRLVEKTLGQDEIRAAYVHLFRMAPYVEQYSDLYRVVDLTDVISDEIEGSLPYRSRISQTVYGIEQPRIADYERKVAEWADETWLISNRDKLKLSQVCALSNLQTIPNGVDMDRFFPIEAIRSDKQLIFVGNLSIFHNLDALRFLVRDVMPVIHKQEPDCTLLIVGSGINQAVRDLACGPGIELAGFVDDLNGALNSSTLFIAPLRFSAGVQNKVLEAMAAGLPVVATSTVNAGLGAEPDRELLVADRALLLAESAVRLLRDQPLRNALARAGRQFVKRQFSWDFAARRMQHIEKLLLRTPEGNTNKRSGGGLNV